MRRVRPMLSCTAPRPLWLLPEPIPLAEHQHRPVYGTPLTLLSGPERIESGWWDGQWAERDYFIARDEQHALLWIFRPRVPDAASSRPLVSARKVRMIGQPSWLCRAALRNELQFSARRFARRRTGRARRGARLRGTGDYRRMLARRRRARARRSQGARPASDHRQRNQSADCRRRAVRKTGAAGDRSCCLRQPV